MQTKRQYQRNARIVARFVDRVEENYKVARFAISMRELDAMSALASYFFHERATARKKASRKPQTQFDRDAALCERDLRKKASRR